MSQRIADWLLAVAARRWPAHLREEMSREWAGELHALGHEESVVAALRKWRQLRFAASLALARPPGADPAPLPWLRGPSQVRAHAGWLFLAPLFSLVLAMAATVSLGPLTGWLRYTPATAISLLALNYVVHVALAATVGTLLARRLLRRRAGRALGVAGCGWATLPVIAGLLAVDVLARAVNQVWDGALFAVVAALCLSVLLPPVAAGVAALSRRARRVSATILAGLAAPALTLATAYAMVLQAPQTPAVAAGRPWWWLAYLGRGPLLLFSYHDQGDSLPIETVLPVLPGLVFIAVVLALAHTVRLARPLRSAASAVPSTSAVPTASAAPSATVTPAITPLSAIEPNQVRASQVPAAARGPWWHRVALAGAIYSVLAWAVTLTYLTPNIGVQNSWPSRIMPDGSLLPPQPAGWPGWSGEEERVWMHELQLSGIVCAALCMLLAAAYRGRPLLPTLAGSAVLLGVNMAVVRGGWTTPRLLPWLAAGGIILGIAVWTASTNPAVTRRPPRRPRRLVITITVLAAFLVPGGFLARLYLGDRQAPPVLLLVAVGLPTVLAIVAAMGVLATSSRQLSGPYWRLPATFALLTAIGGVLYYQYSPEPTLSGEWLMVDYLSVTAAPGLAVPVAAWTIVAIRGRTASLRRLGQRMLLALPLFIVGILATPGTVTVGVVLSLLVLFPMEYGRAYDGVPYLPGAIAVGLLLGFITATRLDRPGPSPSPATHDNPAPAQLPSG
ncbi:hypothetical protein [Solwaraspora sp. WMMD792]|uniref:hypothetical protein n=1 Tax=Solwaraspora sp. WMMD792 TaxID=3016099 RepID=UPI0024170954|nr:hypothetical protein [Solwaraspora sp. WMMD792]MDG4772961.1 hypothetical protein [Solwaraspora sp. WMMD792]